MLKKSWPALALLLSGCGFFPAGGKPVVEAHRGGASELPQNSRAAMLNAIEKRYPGLEFDIALSKDGVPVLSHDPWVHQTLCTRANGTPLPQAKEDRIFIRDLTLDEIKDGFVCGGVRDETQPDAQLVAEPMMSFDELIDELKKGDAPDMLIHIDVKYEPGMSAEPESFAEQVLSRWRAAKLPNPWYVSANLPEALRAFKALETDEEGGAVPTSLIWPRFPPDSESQQVSIALGAEFAGRLGLSHAVSLAREAQADGIAIPYQVVDREVVEAARRAGLQVQVWTLNSPVLLDTFCNWPVDSVITDMPAEAPCR